MPMRTCCRIVVFFPARFHAADCAGMNANVLAEIANQVEFSKLRKLVLAGILHISPALLNPLFCLLPHIMCCCARKYEFHHILWLSPSGHGQVNTVKMKKGSGLGGIPLVSHWSSSFPYPARVIAFRSHSSRQPPNGHVLQNDVTERCLFFCCLVWALNSQVSRLWTDLQCGALQGDYAVCFRAWTYFVKRLPVLHKEFKERCNQVQCDLAAWVQEEVINPLRAFSLSLRFVFSRHMIVSLWFCEYEVIISLVSVLLGCWTASFSPLQCFFLMDSSFGERIPFLLLRWRQ